MTIFRVTITVFGLNVAVLRDGTSRFYGENGRYKGNYGCLIVLTAVFRVAIDVYFVIRAVLGVYSVDRVKGILFMTT